MHRTFPILSVLAWMSLSLGSPLEGVDHRHHMPSSDRIPSQEIDLIQGLNPVHHPVSTSSVEAQRFFDQGLTFIYAFNHDASYLSFKRAAEIDPNLAMAYWGMALALGSNINTTITEEKQQKAYALIQQALRLAPRATPNEQAYIQALAQRYTNQPNPDLQALNIRYKDSMKQVVDQYPDDLDAATLYAESILDLNPWNQWTHDGQPKEGTMEVVTLLESILKKDPDHLGANHYYIHAVEASNHPERALPSANRLRFMSPVAGHINHMPSHIYLLLGDYEEAARANERAVEADRAYIRKYGLGEYYTIHYLSHNLSMLSRAYMMMGNFQNSLRAAIELQNFYGPHFNRMPELEYYYSSPLFVLLRFHRWQDILQVPPPQNPEMIISKAIWHYARAMAFANLGDEQQARAELQEFERTRKDISPQADFGYNKADAIMQIAHTLILATFAEKEDNLPHAVQLLKEAVKLQDNLHYNEPPDWFYPIRESLGGLLLRMHQYPEAEQVFRQDLKDHPRNGRSLFGLLQSLQAQSRSTDAFWIQRSFNKAWRNSDILLNINSL